MGKFYKGPYVAIDGVDFSGKSTVVKSLKKMFYNENYIFTKEPYYPRFRDIIINDPLISEDTRYLLLLADRNEHCDKILVPNSDKLIISDRSFLSGMAYGTELWNVGKIMQKFTGAVNINALHIIFTLDYNDFLLRYEEVKNRDVIESKEPSELYLVQDKLLKAASMFGITPVVINASCGREELLEATSKEITLYMENYTCK